MKRFISIAITTAVILSGITVFSAIDVIGSEKTPETQVTQTPQAEENTDTNTKIAGNTDTQTVEFNTINLNMRNKLKNKVIKDLDFKGIRYKLDENGIPHIYEPKVTNTLSFVGDCLISTNMGDSSQGTLNWYANNYEPEYFLSNVADIFKNDDLTIVDCETVLSDRNLTRRHKPETPAFWFIGPAKNAKILSSSGVEVASLANNHTNDYGEQGMIDTAAALRNVGINPLEPNKPIYIEKNGVTFGILGCALWWGGAEDSVIPIVKEMCTKSDVQIVYPHGGQEKIHSPEQWRKTAFRKLIDAGADLVIANHAHVLQPYEKYNGKTIVYGLGNFCYGGHRHPENRSVIYQSEVTFDRDTKAVEIKDKLIPCYVYTGSTNNWQPKVIDDSDPVKQKILDFMNWKTNSPV